MKHPITGCLLASLVFALPLLSGCGVLPKDKNAMSRSSGGTDLRQDAAQDNLEQQLEQARIQAASQSTAAAAQSAAASFRH